VLEAGDSITVASINLVDTDQAFVNLYNGASKDVLGGTVQSERNNDFLYTFSDSSTLRKNGSGTSYTTGNNNKTRIASSDSNEAIEVDFLPPAKAVTRIDVGGELFNGARNLGAEVILKD
jgi:hypothetical protein